jgi:hypothetical protein
MKTKSVLVAGAILASCFAWGSANAGQFELWSDVNAKSGQVTMIASFAGDGMTQDAQADIDFDPEFTLVGASAKVAGSVCVGLPGQSKVRVVPPSGAGTALTSKAVDYCSFTFKNKGGSLAKAPSFKLGFVECASPTGMHACGGEAIDVSAK